MDDGIVDGEETKDLIWICKQFSKEGKIHDIVALSIQELHGVFLDGFIDEKERMKVRAFTNKSFSMIVLLKILNIYWLETKEILVGSLAIMDVKLKRQLNYIKKELK